jgi:hypothetical protein
MKEAENLKTAEVQALNIPVVSGSTGLKIRGFIHEHPKYDKNGNWNTDVEYGDILVCAFGGFKVRTQIYCNKR